ncbi:phospholipase D-like domain-containing protein [Sandaracinobacteroides saxicola]|uniref:Phospholipase D n=1 Tax=Sandaracinobacteroides saxicola TaxID=2759707 RepID=A0A7G5IKK8_9SPHN|nr:phospholipase D family protein [Sandaracinobacteroides saxicola]QMW23900.1 hypothetical protein H3309_05350 [Sandaracinobacteroides saxicola]
MTPALFLPPGSGPDAPYPPRAGCAVEPLVLAAAFYPALEAAILGATHSLNLAFRILDPDTKTRSPEATAAGLATWGELLADAAHRGLTVRLLLSDFEPTLGQRLHADSWRTWKTLHALTRDAHETHMQVLVVQHEGELGGLFRHLARLPVWFFARRTLASLAADAFIPGLSPWRRPTSWRHLPRLWPATYHQKFAVVDGHTAFVGGLDIDERRWDDRRHRRRVGDSWHDLSARVTGPVVADFHQHFCRLWEMESERLPQRLKDWMAGEAPDIVFTPCTPAPAPPASGNARVQLVRTQSRRNPVAWAVGPIRRITEIEEAHRRLINSAETILYIEAQFFRLRRVARWIVKRARQCPALQVIILLPNAPEEVAFDGDRRAPHRHGEWLQMRAIRHLRRRIPRRVGLFSLAQQQRARPDEIAEYEEGRGVGFGSGMIHVHSKLLIADDHSALISSANINGRSFRWDTETGFLWHEPGAVGAFRDALWHDLLQRDSIAPETALDSWREQAVANAARKPEERQGFIVPHQITKARAFARPSWFVPDDLV